METSFFDESTEFLRCFSKQRRFAPTIVRHHPDNCSTSSGIAVRLPSESLFAITGIRNQLPAGVAT